MKRMLSCVCCLIMVFFASAQAGLVAHYSFEENLTESGLVVSNSVSGGWGNATADNGVGSRSEGISGYGYRFNSADYVNTGNKLSATGDWTVMGWVKQDPSSSNSVLFGQYANGAAGQMIVNSSRGDSGLARLGIWLTGASGTESITVAGTTVIDDSQWHFLAFTRSGDTFTVYVDGVAENSGTLAGVSLNQTLNLYIGNLGAQSVDVPTGYIDEVSIYDNAQSSADILDAYNSIPEPATLMLLGFGGLALLRKK